MYIDEEYCNHRCYQPYIIYRFFVCFATIAENSFYEVFFNASLTCSVLTLLFVNYVYWLHDYTSTLYAVLIYWIDEFLCDKEEKNKK